MEGNAKEQKSKTRRDGGKQRKEGGGNRHEIFAPSHFLP